MFGIRHRDTTGIIKEIQSNNLKERATYEDLNVDGRITQKRILRKQDVRVLTTFILGQRPVVGSCEHKLRNS